MKNTALTGVRRELGARIVPFTGYNMPMEYSGVKDGHITAVVGSGATGLMPKDMPSHRLMIRQKPQGNAFFSILIGLQCFNIFVIMYC